MEIQASLILQSESILSNKKANDSCENYSNTLWNLHEHFRARSDFEINPVLLTYCTWLCHEVPQNKQTSIPLGLK